MFYFNFVHMMVNLKNMVNVFSQNLKIYLYLKLLPKIIYSLKVTIGSLK